MTSVFSLDNFDIGNEPAHDILKTFCVDAIYAHHPFRGPMIGNSETI